MNVQNNSLKKNRTSVRLFNLIFEHFFKYRNTLVKKLIISNFLLLNFTSIC